MLKFLLTLLAKVVFRYRTFNTEVLTTPGPVLLIPNHVSWFDWMFLGILLDEDWKFVTSSTTAETSWLHRKIMINDRTFPIDTTSPYAVRHMAEYLKSGGRLVLFAEGRLSRTGTLMKLFDGTGFLLHKTGAKVINCYLRNASRLPASPNPGKKSVFQSISAHFSDVGVPPKHEHLSSAKARAVYTRWLRDRMTLLEYESENALGPATVPLAIAEAAARQPGKKIIEDMTLKPLTYRRLLAGAGALADALGDPLIGAGRRVGVLLPNINALPVTLMALWRVERVPAILNYSVGMATLHACCEVADLTKVITSREFLKRIKLDPAEIEAKGVQLVYLDDVRESIGKADRLLALAGAMLGPTAPYESGDHDDTAVVLFTSGSEGVPKGVELSHRNLLSNIRQVTSVLDIMDTDRVFNSLPMFHSFGITAATLMPLVRGLYSFVYPSPLHYRVVPTAFYNTDCTIMFGTNTFLNGYARKAHPYDFRNVRFLVA
ncbi:MAG: AMP-binding protein, partial [Limisphaerales bacterium]